MKSPMEKLLTVRNLATAALAAFATLATFALLVDTAFASGATSHTPGAAQITALSNETTRTTWAFPAYAARIHVEPSVNSRAIAKLRVGTPDGMGLQTYLLLSERTTPSSTWVKLRVPGRPNGRTGWVQRGALSDFQVVNTELVVNRATERLTLYRNGRAVLRAPVAVGKRSTPTPAGHFWITEAFASTDPAYGPYAFGTTAYSALSDWPGGGVVGLHGTNEPWLVPGAPSHGCIRLHNRDILRLERLLPIGTPIWIR
jgi:lipoprotein-anchoring transpeptidase ErfK/SrfK